MRKGTREAVAAWREAETKFHRIYKTSRCEAREFESQHVADEAQVRKEIQEGEVVVGGG